jgi:hypothetical protein
MVLSLIFITTGTMSRLQIKPTANAAMIANKAKVI